MTGPLIFTPEYYQRMRELESEGWWNAGMRDIAAMLLRYAHLPPTGVLLDVGCGSGQTMAWFRQLHPGWSAVGLDVAHDALRAADALGERVARASALALPYRDASVDLVITLDVVQHLPLGGGDGEAMREIRRVLRPGGYLLLRTNAQAFPAVQDDHEYNFHRYQPGELRAKLEDAGLRVVRLSRVNALLGLAEIPRELRAARRKPETQYRGILATPRTDRRWVRSVKRQWLGVEGRVMRAGVPIPFGRTILALCRT